MPTPEQQNVDIVLALLAAMAKLSGRMGLDGDKLEKALPAALEILRDELAFFYRDPVTGRYKEFHTTLSQAQALGFCAWRSPHFRTLDLSFSPLAAHQLLEERADREIIEKAARAWYTRYCNA
ncbi:MAG: hypothetical protein UY23_C0001G0409 [Candidatus Jorgensenbacteria bacterium GW2011_GWA1_48_11]|uniref:Uncharacterized protein n=1 Tax=Candidatus Jorgensenbacteria bacterium GW2011_GWA1_48_11 TaxID=1618660 RepID=A0A0G1WN75_9BACT|nr:MAG: hypothetical protein UY23_C0001G0409 [Candidatus Jorgensenbacteria bacterium GW2011_GWA1_48_11]KKW12294.1 MAG: hypothetical protein UY51_C0005G0536 [Candidatus Jorgensenbacteria bacterium GW2011_GWB1_49_9]